MDKVGGATVTILTFDTENNRISVSTFDVHTGTWRNDSYEQYEVAMFSTHITGGGVSPGSAPIGIPVAPPIHL